jgi:prepilin-type N-terminal cleavage/methylation domain-containing protein
MNGRRQPRTSGQAGFTLIELIIASAISLIVASALVEVILTSVTASNIAFGRVEASSQIRTFETRAYDDFALSSMPDIGGLGCGNSSTNPCTTSPIVLNGLQASNSTSPTASPVQITYAWDGATFLDRSVGGSSTELGTTVTGFSWYEDSTTNTVVVQMTVTEPSYSETQTFWFYPRVAG